jgi:hypothetical protein
MNGALAYRHWRYRNPINEVSWSLADRATVGRLSWNHRAETVQVRAPRRGREDACAADSLCEDSSREGDSPLWGRELRGREGRSAAASAMADRILGGSRRRACPKLGLELRLGLEPGLELELALPLLLHYVDS